MSLEAINNPRIVARKESSIILNWEDVYPPIEDNSHLDRGIQKSSPPKIKPSHERIYDVRIKNDIDEWHIVYWYIL